MGGGKHTKQDNVPKKPRSYNSDGAAVMGGGGGGFDKEAAGACLISFKAKINLVTDVSVGTKFMLIPTAGNEGLELISNGKRIGAYSGDRLELLRQCIAGGYTYQGVVNNIQQDTAEHIGNCTITGLGPV